MAKERSVLDKIILSKGIKIGKRVRICQLTGRIRIVYKNKNLCKGEARIGRVVSRR